MIDNQVNWHLQIMVLELSKTLPILVLQGKPSCYVDMCVEKTAKELNGLENPAPRNVVVTFLVQRISCQIGTLVSLLNIYGITVIIFAFDFKFKSV